MADAPSQHSRGSSVPRCSGAVHRRRRKQRSQRWHYGLPVAAAQRLGDGRGYETTFLAPGLEEQSIKVTVHDDTVAIEGKLRFEIPEGAKEVWQEFGPATFRRSIRLGTAVDSAKVEGCTRTG